MLACCEWIDDFSGPSGCRILELTSSMAAQSSVPRNVHFRHTARLINALIAAQKPYQLLLFPNDAWQDLKCLVLRCRLGRKILDAVLARRQARFEMTGTTLKAVKWKWKLREMYPDSRRTHRNQPKETALLCWTMQPQFLQATSRCLEGLKFLTHQNVSTDKVPTWEKHLRTAQYSFMDAEVRKMLRKDTPQGVRRRSNFVIGGGGVVDVEQFAIINSLEEWHGNDWITWINILGFKKCSGAEFSRIFFCPSRGFRTVSLWKSASSHLYRNLVAVYFDNFGRTKRQENGCNILYLARCYQQGVLEVQAVTFFPAIADKVIIQGPQWAPPLGGGLGSSCD